MLSQQMFDRIVGHSDEIGRHATVLPAGCRRAPDRRNVARVSYGQRTQIRRDRGKNAGAWETVLVKDISTKGIGFLCDDPMEPGDTFVLKLTDKQEQLIRIRCRIERCERGGFGSTSFMLGALFQQMIQEAPLRVNDDEGNQPRWQEEAVEEQPEAAMAGPAMKKKPAGPVTRAVRFLRGAVDPSQWARRSDDYSSVG